MKGHTGTFVTFALVVAFATAAAALAGPGEHRNVNGTLWVANRGEPRMQ